MRLYLDEARKKKSNQGTLETANIHLDYGKIIPTGNPDAGSIPAENIEGTQTKPGNSYVFRSCAREGSATGTTGNFDLKGLSKVDLNVSWVSRPYGPRYPILRP